MRTVAFVLVSLAWSAYADIPTPEQDCVNNRSATCERNGVRYQLDDACPDGTTTLKPFERVDCSDAAIRQRLKPSLGHDVATPVAQEKVRSLFTLVPTLLALIALIFFARKRHRKTGPIETWRTLFRSAAGVAAGVAASMLAFAHAMKRFDNHDSAGPVLIATGAATLAFFAVTLIVTWAISRLMAR